MYYTLPRFRRFEVDPITSILLTFIVFDSVGFWGCYFLLRSVFRFSTAAAFLGATLFLFNGFYSHRIVFGHITFHAYMATPFLAFFVLRNFLQDNPIEGKRFILDVVLSSLIIVYMLFAGMIHGIIPVLIIVIIVSFIYGILEKDTFIFRIFAFKLFLIGLLSIILSSSKLLAVLSFVKHFNRDFYPLPGIPNLLDIITILVKSLFWGPDHEAVWRVLVNFRWLLDRHEFEFGVTVVPLLLLITSGFVKIRYIFSAAFWHSFRLREWFYLGAVCFLLILPIGLNYYTQTWNELLKQIPLIKDSSTLFRWFIIYIPIVILLAVIGIEKTPVLNNHRIYLAVICIAFVVIININTNRDYYHNQNYNPGVILMAYQKAKEKGAGPRINEIGVFLNRSAYSFMPLHRNNILAEGKSQLLCYEALFGYRLESFPIKTLMVGPKMQESNGVFNIKNPACYVFPRENNCNIGDHFKSGQRKEANAFINYKKYSFKISLWQKIANYLSLISFALVIIFLAAYKVCHKNIYRKIKIKLST